MEIDFSGLDRRATYGVMTQAILPRPIAWVMTDCGADLGTARWNLAPFSYFNGASSDPPLTVFSIGHGLDDRPRKDTYRNLLERPQFVIHVASARQLEQVHGSSRAFPWGESEVEALGLEVEEWDWPVPRLAGCRLAFASELVDLIPVAAGQEQTLVISRVHRLWVDETVVSHDRKGRIVIDPMGVDPLCRLGAGLYGSLASAFRPQTVAGKIT